MDVLIEVSFLCLLFPLLCKAANDCPPAAASFCSRNYFAVRFPFQFNSSSGGSQRPAGGNNNSGGYPGFNLSCNSNNQEGQVILNLPNHSGDFYVRNIDYRAQTVRLYDPKGCLPARLLSLNLSGSPFKAYETQNYTYLRCPSNETQGRFTSIDCLSNSSTSTLATSSTSLATILILESACRIVAEIPVPIVQPAQYIYNDFSSTLSEDIYLSWDTPDCKYCEASGGTCGLINGSRQDTVCSYAKPGKNIFLDREPLTVGVPELSSLSLSEVS